MKDPKRVKTGKANRRKGLEFELKVRKDLEKKGWFVSKWNNNIDLDKQTMIAAKGNRFKARTLGFPDFIIFRNIRQTQYYEIYFVEAKSNGTTTSEEKKKLDILMDLTGISAYIASKSDYGLISYKPLITSLNLYDVKGGIE